MLLIVVQGVDVDWSQYFYDSFLGVTKSIRLVLEEYEIFERLTNEHFVFFFSNVLAIHQLF